MRSTTRSRSRSKPRCSLAALDCDRRKRRSQADCSRCRRRIELAFSTVQALVAQLRATLQAIDEFDAAITEVAECLPDYPLFASLPGAGSILAPRLLVAFGEQRERYGSAAELQNYAGVAPVLERSGNKCWIHWRLACPTFLRQTFVEWAGSTIPRSFWAGAYYQRQRAKGCSHQAALRALAYKWIRIVYRCWQTRTPYDESVYLNALKRRGSPLIADLATTAQIA